MYYIFQINSTYEIHMLPSKITITNLISFLRILRASLMKIIYVVHKAIVRLRSCIRYTALVDRQKFVQDCVLERRLTTTPEHADAFILDTFSIVVHLCCTPLRTGVWTFRTAVRSTNSYTRCCNRKFVLLSYYIHTHAPIYTQKYTFFTFKMYKTVYYFRSNTSLLIVSCFTQSSDKMFLPVSEYIGTHTG